jgi:hypothetical protein
LADLLVELKSLVPEGQEVVLGTIGPGSRLVLEALGLIHVGAGGLTDTGVQVCEVLAERDAEDQAGLVVNVSGRFRTIASVLAHADLGRTAASTGQEATVMDPSETASMKYDIHMDRPGELRRGPADAAVYAVRRGGSLLVWQVDTGGSVAVVESSSGHRLPVGGSKPVVLPNPDNQPPSVLIRSHLALEPGDE